jgi:hypothetical protein
MKSFFYIVFMAIYLLWVSVAISATESNFSAQRFTATKTACTFNVAPAG